MDCADHRNSEFAHCPQCLALYWKTQYEILAAAPRPEAGQQSDAFLVWLPRLVAEYEKQAKHNQFTPDVSLDFVKRALAEYQYAAKQPAPRPVPDKALSHLRTAWQQHTQSNVDRMDWVDICAEIASFREDSRPVPDLPVAITPDEMASLARFCETCEDGQEYDIPVEMMRQLAEIGLVRRTTGSRYEITNFGLAVTAGKFNARPAQPDATVTDYGTIKQSHDSVGNVDQPTPIPTGRTHELKTDPIVFDAVLSRRKTFEIRYNDRDYHTGDTLILRRTRYTGDEMLSGEPLIYVGNPLPVTITYMMHGPAYGLAPGWVIMGIAPAQPAPIKTGPSGKTMWTATMPDRRKKPAPIPAVNQRCEIGIYGKSWDGPEATRAYTHEHQPDNVVASRLGRAVYKARQHTPGDHIDLGLYLLRELMDVGFGVFELPRPAAHGGE